MLRPDPAQRERLEEIRVNLIDRIAEAEREGWLGDVEGLETSSQPRRRSSPKSTPRLRDSPRWSTWASPPSSKSPAAAAQLKALTGIGLEVEVFAAELSMIRGGSRARAKAG